MPIDFFCRKLNPEQLLLDPFFDIRRIFGSIEAQKEFTWPFFVHFNISKMTIFGAPMFIFC